MLDSAQTRPSGAPIGTRLSLGILGGLSVSVAGTPLGLNLRKARLAGLLWDGGKQQARSALRTELYGLGKSLAALGCLPRWRSR